MRNLFFCLTSTSSLTMGRPTSRHITLSTIHLRAYTGRQSVFYLFIPSLAAHSVQSQLWICDASTYTPLHIFVWNVIGFAFSHISLVQPVQQLYHPYSTPCTTKAVARGYRQWMFVSSQNSCMSCLCSYVYVLFSYAHTTKTLEYLYAFIIFQLVWNRCTLLDLRFPWNTQNTNFNMTRWTEREALGLSERAGNIQSWSASIRISSNIFRYAHTHKCDWRYKLFKDIMLRRFEMKMKSVVSTAYNKPEANRNADAGEAGVHTFTHSH